MLAFVLGALALAWFGVSLYVLATRVLHDLGRTTLARLQRDDADARAWRLLPRRTVELVAADAATPAALAEALSARALEDDPGGIVGRAWNGARWRRITALRIVTRARWALAPVLLEHALAGDDEAVVTVAVAALGEIGDAHASALLVDALRDGRASRSRIATQLDQAAGSSPELLVPLLHDRDPAVRFWGATLLGRHAASDRAALALIALTGDANPSVRSAAVEGIAGSALAEAPRAAHQLLADPVWYVRVHAVRTLGSFGQHDLLSAAPPLLADDSWWVRSAAKEALERNPLRAAELLVDYLEHPDEFARNGAAEILQNIGLLDDLVDDARTNPAQVRLLVRILNAGGKRLTASAGRRSGLDPGELERLAAAS